MALPVPEIIVFLDKFYQLANYREYPYTCHFLYDIFVTIPALRIFLKNIFFVVFQNSQFKIRIHFRSYIRWVLSYRGKIWVSLIDLIFTNNTYVTRGRWWWRRRGRRWGRWWGWRWGWCRRWWWRSSYHFRLIRHCCHLTSFTTAIRIFHKTVTAFVAPLTIMPVRSPYCCVIHWKDILLIFWFNDSFLFTLKRLKSQNMHEKCWKYEFKIFKICTFIFILTVQGVLEFRQLDYGNKNFKNTKTS